MNIKKYYEKQILNYNVKRYNFIVKFNLDIFFLPKH